MKTNENENDGNLNSNPHPNFGEFCVASCRKLLAQLDAVKDQVMSEFRVRVVGNQRVLELAVNEAEALAWESGIPQLIFPTLALEKASAATNWHLHQKALLQRTQPILAFSA